MLVRRGWSQRTRWTARGQNRKGRCAVEPLTVKEAAPRLRLSEASVYALCAAKKLRHQRVGLGRGKIVIPPDAISEYLSKGTVKSAEAHPTALLSAARK
ncbi:helix-turn-helix domain-containing protein [Fimbriiglobus ruber]|uniref:helix-turn-helix domain-containing protein n=1 Tax=Fimbriiglobus ruber TaxID=1908690 RepID=UPI000B4B4371